MRPRCLYSLILAATGPCPCVSCHSGRSIASRRFTAVVEPKAIEVKKKKWTNMDVIYKAYSEAMGITQGHIAQGGDTIYFFLSPSSSH